MEKLEPLRIAGKNVKWCSHWKTVWWVLKKLNIGLPYDPVIPLLGIHPQRIESSNSNRYLHTCVHSSSIHGCQKVKATQVSISG